jgi:hypothetical protein
MPPIYDLIIDLPDGIGARPVDARYGKEAFEIGRRLFNECRQAGAVRGEEEVDDDLL